MTSKEKEGLKKEESNTEPSPPKNLTKEQISKLTPEELTNYIAHTFVENLNRNVMNDREGQSR